MIRNVTRDRLLTEATQFSGTTLVRSKVEYSTVYLTGTVVDPIPGTATQAFVKIARASTQTFFSYGLNGDQSLKDGFGNAFKPDRCHTSIDQAYRLAPKTKMAVEWFTILPGKIAPRFASSQSTADTAVIAAFGGTLNGNFPVELHDPFSVMLPKELTVGPQSLHNAVMEALRGVTYVEQVWGSGTSGTNPIGPMRLIPTGDTEAYVNTFGDGAAQSVYRLDEGLLWDAETERDGRIGFKITTERDIILPITANAQVIGSATKVTPTIISIPLTMVVGGLQVTFGDMVNGS
jgi:hypothetical protein